MDSPEIHVIAGLIGGAVGWLLTRRSASAAGTVVLPLLALMAFGSLATQP